MNTFGDRRGSSTFQAAGNQVFDGGQQYQNDWSQKSSVGLSRQPLKKKKPRIWDHEAAKNHIGVGFQGQQDWFEDYKIAKNYNDPYGINRDHVNLGQGGPQDDECDAFFKRNQLGKKNFQERNSKAAVQPKLRQAVPRARPRVEQPQPMGSTGGPGRTQEWTHEGTADQWDLPPKRDPTPMLRQNPSDWPSREQSREHFEQQAYYPVGGPDHFKGLGVGVANGNNWQAGSRRRVDPPRGQIGSGMVSEVDGWKGSGMRVDNKAQRDHFQSGMNPDDGNAYRPKIKMSGKGQQDHFASGMNAANDWNQPNNVSPGRKATYRKDHFANVGMAEGDADTFRSGKRVMSSYQDNFDEGMGLKGLPQHREKRAGQFTQKDHWNEINAPFVKSSVPASTYPSNLGAHAGGNRRYQSRVHGKASLAQGLMYDHEAVPKKKNLGPYQTSYEHAHHKTFKSGQPLQAPEARWGSHYSSFFGREEGVVDQRLQNLKPNGLRSTFGQLKIN